MLINAACERSCRRFLCRCGSLDISCVSPLAAQIARPDNFAGCSFGVCRCLTLPFLVNIFNTFRKSSQPKWWLQWNVFEA